MVLDRHDVRLSGAEVRPATVLQGVHVRLAPRNDGQRAILLHQPILLEATRCCRTWTRQFRRRISADTTRSATAVFSSLIRAETHSFSLKCTQTEGVLGGAGLGVPSGKVCFCWPYAGGDELSEFLVF